MKNVHHLPLRLVANRRLLDHVSLEAQPCGALGFVEAAGRVRSMVLLNLPGCADVDALGDDFHLTVEPLGSLDGFLLALTLALSAVRWHLLVDPGRSACQAVLQALLFEDEYYVLVMGYGVAAAYRIDDPSSLAAIRPVWAHASRASLPRSEQAALRESFRERLPTGEEVLECVAGDDPSLLLLTEPDRTELALAR